MYGPEHKSSSFDCGKMCAYRKLETESIMRNDSKRCYKNDLTAVDKCAQKFDTFYPYVVGDGHKNQIDILHHPIAFQSESPSNTPTVTSRSHPHKLDNRPIDIKAKWKNGIQLLIDAANITKESLMQHGESEFESLYMLAAEAVKRIPEEA